QLVVGGVQRDRQTALEALVGQLEHRRDEADRGDGDAALGQAEAVGGGVGQPPDGADDAVVVGQRLAHAHEDDVGKPRRASGDLAVPQGTHAVDDLVHDLGGGQITVQTGL